MRKIVSLLLLSLLVITGCSFGTPPEDVVKSFLGAMIAGDFETVAKLTDGTNIEEDITDTTTQDKESEQLAKSVISRVSYEIGEKKIEGNTAEVGVKITAPDLLRITGKVVSELIPMAFAMAFSEDQSEEESNALFQQYFMNAINDPNAPLTTSDVKVKLEKKDGSWVVKPDDELLNALTGNMEKAFSELDKETEN